MRAAPREAELCRPRRQTAGEQLGIAKTTIGGGDAALERESAVGVRSRSYGGGGLRGWNGRRGPEPASGGAEGLGSESERASRVLGIEEGRWGCGGGEGISRG
jgi:hypothetical protein